MTDNPQEEVTVPEAPKKLTRVVLQRVYLDAKFAGPDDVDKPGWNYKVIEAVNILRPDILPGMWLKEPAARALVDDPAVDDVVLGE